MSKILVLMSTYNGEQYLVEQIDSILVQEGVDVQLLVRDDGSTDGTIKILEDYKKQGKLKWYSGSNLKSAKSFMDLLKKSDDCEYYAFSDQDDYWMPDKLARAVELIEKRCGDKKPALYFGNKEIVDENLKKLRLDSKVDYAVTFQSSMMRCVVTGCTVVINKKLRDALNGYAPDYIVMHDAWAYRVCLALGGSVVYDLEPHIKYRQHSGNVIGFNNDFRGKLKRRVKGFIKPDHSREKTARELILGYGDRMNNKYLEQLKWIASYRSNFGDRMKLLFSNDFKADGFEDSIVFKTAVLFGKV